MALRILLCSDEPTPRARLVYSTDFAEKSSALLLFHVHVLSRRLFVVVLVFILKTVPVSALYLLRSVLVQLTWTVIGL